MARRGGGLELTEAARKAILDSKDGATLAAALEAVDAWRRGSPTDSPRRVGACVGTRPGEAEAQPRARAGRRRWGARMDGVTLLREACAAGLEVFAQGGELRVRGPRSAEDLARRVPRTPPRGRS